MSTFFKKRTKIEKLSQQYQMLMQRSYKRALKSKEESEEIKKEAAKIYKEIELLNALT